MPLPCSFFFASSNPNCGSDSRTLHREKDTVTQSPDLSLALTSAPNLSSLTLASDLSPQSQLPDLSTQSQPLDLSSLTIASDLSPQSQLLDLSL